MARDIKRLNLPHDAHAGWTNDGTAFTQATEMIVSWCSDCDWVQSFSVREHGTPLAAWNEAARARDVHHDTNRKEIS